MRREPGRHAACCAADREIPRADSSSAGWRVLERRAEPGRPPACCPPREFLDTEVAGGLVLLATTAMALLWANSLWSSAYAALWGTELAVEVGRWTLALDLRHWINDGLMALFFFVVGLEIKRELVAERAHDARSGPSEHRSV